MAEKQFVLCFDNEGESKEDMGGSYVLQFEDGGAGGAVDGGVVAEGNSLVLQIKTNGQSDGEKEGDKGAMMSLLQDWGEEKQGGRQTGEESGQGESYVLHFHTEAESSAASGTFSRGQETSLQLTCTRNPSSLVPLDGQEVVFELGAGAKMEQAPEEGMQMIALIGDEGGMAGEMAHCSTAAGGVAEDGGAMEGIFQLESGEGIVIIEVSTSGLRDGGMERGEGREICQTTETVEAKETTKENNPADNAQVQTSAEDSMRNGLLHEKEMHFSD